MLHVLVFMCLMSGWEISVYFFWFCEVIVPPPPFSKNSPWRHRTVRLCFPLHDTVLNAERIAEGFQASQTLPAKQMRCRIVITIGKIITVATEIHPMAHPQVTVMAMVQGAGIQRVPPVLPGIGQVARRTQHRVPGPQTHLITTSKNQNVSFTHWMIGFSPEKIEFMQYHRNANPILQTLWMNRCHAA